MVCQMDLTSQLLTVAVFDSVVGDSKNRTPMMAVDMTD